MPLTRLEQLGQFVTPQRRDDRTAVEAQFDQTFGRELLQGLAQRRARNPERLGQIDFKQRFAGREIATHDQHTKLSSRPAHAGRCAARATARRCSAVTLRRRLGSLFGRLGRCLGHVCLAHEHLTDAVEEAPTPQRAARDREIGEHSCPSRERAADRRRSRSGTPRASPQSNRIRRTPSFRSSRSATPAPRMLVQSTATASAALAHDLLDQARHLGFRHFGKGKIVRQRQMPLGDAIQSLRTPVGHDPAPALRRYRASPARCAQSGRRRNRSR